MLYYLLFHEANSELCILRISKSVLDINDIVITNQNAAVEAGTRFMTAEEAARFLDFNLIRSENWNDRDCLTNDIVKKAMMAEVLVHRCVPKEYIIEIIVPNIKTKKILESKNIGVPITVNNWMFFDIYKEASND